MISFIKIEKYEYQLNCNTKSPLTISLLRNNTVSNKFNTVITSIEAMSKLSGKMFDDHIFNFVNDYQKCSNEDDRFNVLKRNIENTIRFSDFFVEVNSIEYNVFSDENYKTENSIFFDTNDIKNIVKLSQALKIYSLVLNTEFKVTIEKIRDILDQFIAQLKAECLISKIISLIKTIAIYENKGKGYSEEDLNNIINKTIEYIAYNGLMTIDYKNNPIPYFAGIVKTDVKYGWKNKINNLYNFTDNENKQNYGSLLRNESHEKKRGDNFYLNRLCNISLSHLSEIHKYHNKNTSEIIEKIKYTSPIWDAIFIYVFFKTSKISLKTLKKIHPYKAALLSFYLSIKSNEIFNPDYKNIFELSLLYPISEPKNKKYKLKNVSQLINKTIKLNMMDLTCIGGSRVFVARLIENILGNFKSTHFCGSKQLFGRVDRGLPWL